LTKICSGGCALSKSIANTFFLKCGKHILEGYGLTECSPVCTFTDYFFNAPAGSVGTALSCNQIRIKKDINNTGSPSDSGEICIKGKNVFKGYFGKPEMNQLVLKDNWFTSGDYGKIDQYGNLYITGRKKNMINIGSKKVYPKHAERLISLHENVRNISISMTNHPVLTEIAHATVELLEKGEREERTFKKWCLSNFSNHLVPKRISFL
jgi:long-chain acyl-CoA synthetase